MALETIKFAEAWALMERFFKNMFEEIREQEKQQEQIDSILKIINDFPLDFNIKTEGLDFEMREILNERLIIIFKELKNILLAGFEPTHVFVWQGTKGYRSKHVTVDFADMMIKSLRTDDIGEFIQTGTQLDEGDGILKPYREFMSYKSLGLRRLVKRKISRRNWRGVIW
jgi:hypothetical protein